MDFWGANVLRRPLSEDLFETEKLRLQMLWCGEGRELRLRQLAECLVHALQLGRQRAKSGTLFDLGFLFPVPANQKSRSEFFRNCVAALTSNVKNKEGGIHNV